MRDSQESPVIMPYFPHPLKSNEEKEISTEK